MVFLLSIGFLQAQENNEIIKKGTVLALGPTNASGYKHIHFPRKNFIIKHGAIANFNGLMGKNLVVYRIETNKFGMTNAVLKRKDGLKFFRFYPTVSADVDKALEKGELRIVTNF